MEPSSPSSRGAVSRTTLQASAFAVAEARRFVHGALAEGATSSEEISEQLVHDAELLVSELVTNAVLHAGTEIEVACRMEPGPRPPAASLGGERPPGVVVEVADHHPSGLVFSDTDAVRGQRGMGLQLVGALAESWGVTYRHTEKRVWFRLEAVEGRPEAGEPPGARARAQPGIPAPFRPVPAASGRGGITQWGIPPSFLAEASELLAGQLDEGMVAAVAGQLLVPRVADWSGVWLSTDDGRMRLARTWHADERRIDALRLVLEKYPPTARDRATPVQWPWPDDADEDRVGGSAMAFPLVAGGACQGVLLLGRAGERQLAGGVVRMLENVARLMAQAIVTARQYTRQTSISRALQRRQLPPFLASIPGIETAIVYEPHAEAQTVGGDFYDLFSRGDRRWCFLLGDVQGKDPEAMSVTGLARHLVRLLAREGQGVESVLQRLNTAMAEDSEEAVEYGSEYAQPRFLSLLYGELEPDPVEGGAHCTVASAGHPLPLRLFPDGTVETVASPQLLLGIDGRTRFGASSFHLSLGQTLLCVTDGVTERRNGKRQLDDDNGLARILRGCVGMGAMAVAERVRQAVLDFSAEPVGDDVAVLVLHAMPVRVQVP
ncbi:SpoIIE family protein phosphatase [Streptomyces sp. KR80]|uniref:SpoIIE family protein phosphatase n=1 Tax=Streptomyces sp. KR80 TaxID=3457426 RepID=UPI003FCFC240